MILKGRTRSSFVSYIIKSSVVSLREMHEKHRRSAALARARVQRKSLDITDAAVQARGG